MGRRVVAAPTHHALRGPPSRPSAERDTAPLPDRTQIPGGRQRGSQIVPEKKLRMALESWSRGLLKRLKKPEP
jgi:hypothetical protein